MKVNDLTWRIAGEAGDGIFSSATLFGKTCSRGGLQVFAKAEYPSLIRGGHNEIYLRVAEKEIFSHRKHTDVLIALNKESIDRHLPSVSENGALIFDNDAIKLSDEFIKQHAKINFIHVPLQKIALDETKEKVMRNTVALGASFGLLNYGFDVFEQLIKEMFSKKGEEIVQKNMKAAEAGLKYVKENFKKEFSFTLNKIPNQPKRMLISGNEVLALGAIQAGCKFLAAYPMTPASSIMHFFAKMEKPYNLIMKHAEDEIAAINLAIGAGFAGVRAMTSTSGGGFSLMTEALGLAAMGEVPVVVVTVQRPGPSTGLPTRQEQGDLRQVLHASQGEFPRIVISLNSIEDCFYRAGEAFNLAEKFQTPVILLSDKFLGESLKTEEFFDVSRIKIDRGEIFSPKSEEEKKNYKRFKLTDSGVSPRVLPGTEGIVFRSSSDEHDETGYIWEEPDNRKEMVDKRTRKLIGIKKELLPQKIVGESKADLTITCFGSTLGIALEAVKLAEKEKLKVNIFPITYMSPFKSEEVLNVLKGNKENLIIENNQTGQLQGLIKEKTGFEFKHAFNKYNGRQFYPEEILEKIKKVMEMKGK